MIMDNLGIKEIIKVGKEMDIGKVFGKMEQ